MHAASVQWVWDVSSEWPRPCPCSGLSVWVPLCLYKLVAKSCLFSRYVCVPFCLIAAVEWKNQKPKWDGDHSTLLWDEPEDWDREVDGDGENNSCVRKAGEIDVGENEVHESLVDRVHDVNGVFVWKSFSPKTSKRWLTKAHCWTLVPFCLLLQWKSVLYLYTQFVDGNFCLLILRAVTECWSPSKINFLSKWFSLLI